MPKYESTITLGTLLTLLSIFVSVGGIWVRIENLEHKVGLRSANQTYESSRKPGS